MTTSISRIRFFVGAILLIGFFGILLSEVRAQENDLVAPTPVEVVGTTTAEIPEVKEVKKPWFSIEQLTGDNLAVGDFVVGPGRAEIEVKPGQSTVVYISVANRISDNRTFEINVEDIAGSADGSKSVNLLGNQTGPYTIKNYIKFPENTFTLNLGERARIPVTVTIPLNAEPGGFYGSVLISTVRTGADDEEGATTRSPIIARVGTLFFVTVPGDIEYSGETKEISMTNNSWWYEKGPVSFNILFENKGSIHLNPYGELRIKNIFGEEVGFIELEPWFILPKSLRSREIVWDRELLFGRYTATVYVNRGYEDVVDERQVAFWVLPWKIVGGIFLVVFIILFGIRFFFRTFEFKRKS